MELYKLGPKIWLPSEKNWGRQKF